MFCSTHAGYNLMEHVGQPCPQVSPLLTSCVFQCLRHLHVQVFTVISHWLLVKFTFVLIGRCDYFGFGFTTLN